ncbi:MAG: CRISPR-associated protein Cas4 [Patescibacteria group bacterium]|nr:CRISPR-associated protein Cas4 [Patescibacteria group bacterium]
MYENIIITGVQIAYYITCLRKLWLFSKNISMEHTSEFVEIGKLIHDNSYKRKKKEINLDGIKIDLIEAKKGIIHEIKKSKALEESHIWQLKYYLYYFKKLGINLDGIIDYPKLRKREHVILKEEDANKIEDILNNIKNIISEKKLPPTINKKYCKKCSYYELCYC